MDHFLFFFIHLERGRPWIGLRVTAPKKLTFYYYHYASAEFEFVVLYIMGVLFKAQNEWRDTG